MVKRGARASLPDDKQREFTVSSFGPTAMAGRMSQACRDTRASQPWRWAPWIYLGVWPDGYVGGPVVKWGARASLWGRIAVNDQCLATRVHGFKFRARGNGWPDESGVPGYAGGAAMGAGALDLSWRTARRIRRWARGKAIACASLRGRIAVNFQCFKIRAKRQSA